MFKKWKILDLSHYDEVTYLNSRWDTVGGEPKQDGYDEKFNTWIKEYLDPNIENCYCLGYYLDGKLLGYYTLFLLEHWPFAYHDHWRTDPDRPTQTIKHMLSAVPELHDFLESKGIYTWFSVGPTEYFLQTKKVKKRFIPDDIEAFFVEEILPGEKSKYGAFDKYFIQGETYTKPMYVLQHVSKRKFL